MGKAHYLPAADVPTVEEMIENVLGVYDASTKQDVVEGSTWYPRALEHCEMVAELTGYSALQVAAVMALTSAATGWNVNESMPALIIAHVTQNGFDCKKPSYSSATPSTWHKVIRVLRDGDLTAPTGPKITAFYAAIVGDQSKVTIDRHAIRIAAGGGMAEDTTVVGKRRMIEAYTLAADMRGIAPREMQAITWTAFRRMRGIDVKYG